MAWPCRRGGDRSPTSAAWAPGRCWPGCWSSTRRRPCTWRSSCTSCSWCWPPSRCSSCRKPPHGRDVLGCNGFRFLPRYARIFVIAAIAAFAGFAVTGLFTAVAPSFLSQVLGHRQPRGGRARRLLHLRLLGPGSIGRHRNQTAACGGSRLRDPGRRYGDSGCGAAIFVSDRVDRGRGGVRHRAGHQLQPRPGRGRREHTRPNGAPRSARPTSSSPTLRSRCRSSARGSPPKTWGCAPPASRSPRRSLCCRPCAWRRSWFRSVARSRPDHVRKRSTYGANCACNRASSRPNISDDVATRPSRPRWWPEMRLVKVSDAPTSVD